MPHTIRYIPAANLTLTLLGAAGFGAAVGVGHSLVSPVMPVRLADALAGLLLITAAIGAGWCYPRLLAAAFAACVLGVGFALGPEFAGSAGAGGASGYAALGAVYAFVLTSPACLSAAVAARRANFDPPPPVPRCEACGYNINNMIEHQICPECSAPLTPGQVVRFVSGRFRPAEPPPLRRSTDPANS